MLSLDLINTVAFGLARSRGVPLATFDTRLQAPFMIAYFTTGVRRGPAPRAFLVVPMVGAFFIDFVNAVIITVCLNLWT